MTSQMLRNPSGFILAGLIVAGGLLILHLPVGGGTPSGTVAKRRFSIYLLIVSVLLLLGQVIGVRLSQNEQFSFISIWFVGGLPTLMGVLAPIFVRVYAAAGDPPQTDPACEQQLAEITERYGPFYVTDQ